MCPDEKRDFNIAKTAYKLISISVNGAAAAVVIATAAVVGICAATVIGVVLPWIGTLTARPCIVLTVGLAHAINHFHSELKKEQVLWANYTAAYEAYTACMNKCMKK